MPRIFITRAIPNRALKVLTDVFGSGSVDVYEEDRIIPREVLLERVKGADAVLTMLTEYWDEEVFESAGSTLKILANCAVGYNNIKVDAATARGVAVSNTPDVLTESTADLAWALILGACRRVGEAERYLRAGKWDSWSPNFMLGNDVHGGTLGIFGMGRIGRATARRAAGFNMRVIYHSRTRIEADVETELNARYVPFLDLLAESDVISIHCPFTSETRHAFGADQFRAMKSTATLVNISRGPVVDEAALAQALLSGEIAFAGLDVFEKEPKIHSDLLTCENAMLLPHIGSATLETRTQMAELAARNIVARLTDAPLPTCVNPETITD
ncbi:MAG: D-glycerate dehydrogenase [Candidatus Hydrogenedentota bacterium]|nr:MAG: D-glycerate dehydrogenase [Candidatus Hydrogenedentota bacterium]